MLQKIHTNMPKKRRKKSKNVVTINQVTQKKIARGEKRDKITITQTENNEQDGKSKPFSIFNYFKLKWIKLLSQKSQRS